MEPPPCIFNQPLSMCYILLYRSTLDESATTRDTWHASYSFWDLNLVRNFKDDEALEWADQSMVFGPIVITQLEDAWKCPLNPDGHFFTRSLLADMGDGAGFLESYFD